jgi:hypothetical protein
LRGGLTTKIAVIVDALGNLIRFDMQAARS